jgi:Tol biopolymer transport system component
MNGDGSNRLRLTDNGNDIRPVWSPDGLAVVFMSLRDGDWEVYRLDLLTEELLQLTDSPAQDGLPTVSPDGRWVAFASDRGGFWRIWVVPGAGGEAQPLVTINGVLTNWLEHAIQWIP